MLLLDYSLARPTPAEIKAAGYGGVMRYLSDHPEKNLTAAEAKALEAAGLVIGLVWENEALPTGGFAEGADHAHKANAQAAALGVPATTIIFYAFDSGVQGASAVDYARGVHSVGGYPAGIYGDGSVLDAVVGGGILNYGWEAGGSTSWPGWTQAVNQHANLYQRARATVAHPISGTDENVVCKPFPLWAPGAASTPTPISPSPAPHPAPAPRPQAPAPKHSPAPPVPAPPVLRLGTRSAEVGRLQVFLNRAFPAYSRLKVDDYFGPQTEAVVHEFQRRTPGLVPDSTVGAHTYAALEKDGFRP